MVGIRQGQKFDQNPSILQQKTRQQRNDFWAVCRFTLKRTMESGTDKLISFVLKRLRRADNDDDDDVQHRLRPTSHRAIRNRPRGAEASKAKPSTGIWPYRLTDERPSFQPTHSFPLETSCAAPLCLLSLLVRPQVAHCKIAQTTPRPHDREVLSRALNA